MARAVQVLGLKGAELDTVVNTLNWDEPHFLPLFKAAEAMGAVLFFHPQPHANPLLSRTEKYGLTKPVWRGQWRYAVPPPVERIPHKTREGKRA